MSKALSAIHLRLWRIKVRVLRRARRQRAPVALLPPPVISPEPREPQRPPEETWAELAGDYLPPLGGLTVLILGCGDGTLARYLASHEPVAKVIGVDDEPLWEHAVPAPAAGPRHAPVSMIAGRLSALAIPPRSVDVLACTEYLERIAPEDVEQTLTACFDCLRPGGSLIIRGRLYTAAAPTAAHGRFRAPYPQFLASERDLARLLRARHDERLPYVNWLTATSYVILLHRAGFELVDARRLQGFPGWQPPASLTQALPGTSPQELMSGIHALALRPFTLDDLARAGTMEDTRSASDRQPLGSRQ